MADEHKIVTITEDNVYSQEHFDDFTLAKEQFDTVSTLSKVNICYVISRLGKNWVLRVCYVKHFGPTLGH